MQCVAAAPVIGSLAPQMRLPVPGTCMSRASLGDSVLRNLAPGALGRSRIG